MSAFESSVPVLIAGGGACGAVAALAAAEAGAEVLVIEQDAYPRGSTSMSQGLVCAAGTKSQKAHGVEDSGEIFLADILAKTRQQTDPELARAIAMNAGSCLDWLVEKQDMPWQLDTAFRAVYGHSRLRVHGWPGHSGAEMLQLLHTRLAQRGVDVLLDARLHAVVDDGEGRVQGVEIARRNGAIERIGCEALVLATSGFAANPAMVAQYMPEAAQAKYHGHEGNRGDGILMGARLGGALADMGAYQGYGMLTNPQGITLPPGFMMEGGVLLNSLGRRFVNELEDIAGMIHPVLAQPNGVAWAIYDARIEKNVAHIPEAMQLVDLRAARTANTMSALAAVIGANPRRVQDAFRAIRMARASGVLDPHGRSWDNDPPPSAPFRALKVTGALYHTQGGLQIDADSRVLRSNGVGLANVFAGGGAARGVAGPSSWGYLPAIGLCAAVTLGRLAGRAAAHQVLAA